MALGELLKKKLGITTNIPKVDFRQYSGMIAGLPKIGKAQPLNCKVLTPNGFVNMGDIKIGDKVIGEDGNQYNVTGVFPQGIMPSYKITFSDGASTECNDQHIWNVCSSSWKRSHKGVYRNMTLSEIMDIGLLTYDKKRDINRHKWNIPTVGNNISFSKKDHMITPYMLGLLLGDGYICDGIQYSTSESEIIDKISSLLIDGYSINKNKGDNYTWRIVKPECENSNAYTSEMRRLGLYGCLSGDKFIPEEYMYDSYENRLDLLRGLFDTDGHVAPTKQCITTISEQMKNDIVWLCRSLGMMAYVTEDGRSEKYSTGHCYLITIHANNQRDLFTTQKHKDRYDKTPRKTRLVPKRFIESVEYVGDKEMQCIMVDNPSHLYITDDFIVTHNTQLAALLPNAVIVAFESGYDSQAVDVVDCVGDWKGFIDFLDTIEDNIDEIKNELRLLVIDTVPEAYKACETYMLKKESIKAGTRYTEIGDIPHGKGYLALDKYFSEQMKRVYKLGLRPVYITHIDTKTVRPKDKKEEPYDITVTRLPDRLRKIVEPEVSYILFMDRIKDNGEDKRVLRMKNTETMNTNGSRVRLKDDIIFDNEQEAINKFAAAWENTIMENLKASGVAKSVDEIKAEQEKELIDNVDKYTKSIDKAALVPKISAATADPNKRELILSVMGEYGIEVSDFKNNPEKISISAYEKFAEIVEG